MSVFMQALMKNVWRHTSYLHWERFTCTCACKMLHMNVQNYLGDSQGNMLFALEKSSE